MARRRVQHTSTGAGRRRGRAAGAAAVTVRVSARARPVIPSQVTLRAAALAELSPDFKLAGPADMLSISSARRAAGRYST